MQMLVSLSIRKHSGGSGMQLPQKSLTSPFLYSISVAGQRLYMLFLALAFHLFSEASLCLCHRERHSFVSSSSLFPFSGSYLHVLLFLSYKLMTLSSVFILSRFLNSYVSETKNPKKEPQFSQ